MKKDILISPDEVQISLSKKETKILKVFLTNSHIREEIANSIDQSAYLKRCLQNNFSW